MTDPPRRLALISSASGNGKTTLGRELARRLDVPFVELDALVHGPGWVQTPDGELRERLAPVLANPGWVIDGNYERKLGTTVLAAADLVVWLDLPMRVWLPRLARRTWRRWRTHEELWNGNRESVRAALWGWDSLFLYALRSHVRRRRTGAARLAGLPVLRLRTVAEIEAFTAWVTRAGPGVPGARSTAPPSSAR